MLPRQMHRSRLCGEPLSLLMMDIDHFKQFNDTYGHVSGDCGISAVATIVLEALRPTDMAVRFGGEEFLVLLPNCTLEEGRSVAERVRAIISTTPVMLSHGPKLPPLTVSAGVTVLTGQETVEDLVSSADAALYRAKRAGRNCVSQ